MDISKLDVAGRAALCRKYFLIGLCFLPLVWLTNVFWFFNDAFCRPACPARSSIRKYVILSGIGVIIWACVVVSWELIFQTYRAQGLPWADYITFVFPTGRV